MTNTLKLLIYYREYSDSLDDLLRGTTGVSFVKDGLSPYLNHKVPRMTVFVPSTGSPIMDKTLLKKLYAELDSQVRSGLILAWS